MFFRLSNIINLKIFVIYNLVSNDIMEDKKQKKYKKKRPMMKKNGMAGI